MWRGDQQCFFPFQRKYCYCPDINLIPSTFLKATFAMFAPPCLIYLTDTGENRVPLP
jgi:hypothetical protein